MPLDLRDFINVMSLIVFGTVILSALFTLVAYALAINRGTGAYRPAQPTQPSHEPSE